MIDALSFQVYVWGKGTFDINARWGDGDGDSDGDCDGDSEVLL